MGNTRVALVCGVAPGPGGLGMQAANAVAALAAPGVDLHVVAPPMTRWPRPDRAPAVHWHPLQARVPAWSRWPWFRRAQGRAQWRRDVALGRAAAAVVARIEPEVCYAFTQVALETLEWADSHGVPAALDSPNGHLANFRRVYVDEQRRWCGGDYLGHPSTAMVSRVEQEYRAAERIRASSEWTRRSLIDGGVAGDKITVLQQSADLVSFDVPAEAPARGGPLRVVFVGTLDLRKGFVYLLRAARRLAGGVSVELVGGTVDRCTRRLLDASRADVVVRVAPGDPRPALHRAEVAVLPTLEDGSPFAAAEAMASGLPLIVSASCGAREWVEPGTTGWVVPAQDETALVEALEQARQQRDRLREMGVAARAATVRRADPAVCDHLVGEWLLRRR